MVCCYIIIYASNLFKILFASGCRLQSRMDQLRAIVDTLKFPGFFLAEDHANIRLVRGDLSAIGRENQMLSYHATEYVSSIDHLDHAHPGPCLKR
jgi:hypothetical protein